MDTRTVLHRTNSPRSATAQPAARPRPGLLAAGLVLVLGCLMLFGVVRLVRGLDDNSISAWRLVLVFANAFFCVVLACALRARGRRPRRSSSFGRRR